MIRIKNLHKSYPIGKGSLHVLKGIDLHIKEGEFVSIMTKEMIMCMLILVQNIKF